MRPEIDLRLLWYFVAVAEELSFSRAAVRVSIAQPPLSQQIQRLERLLGGALFSREGRRVRLTPAGEALLPAARRLLGDAAETTALVRRISRGEAGTLTVGFIPSTLFSPLPAAVRRFREQHPGVLVQLRQITPVDMDAVRSGRVDIALVREPRDEPGIVAVPVLRERFVAAVPREHPLAAHAAVPVSALRGEPFVLFPEQISPGLYRRVQELCAGAGFEPRVVQEADEWQTIISLVEAGMGVSLIPASLTAHRSDSVAFPALLGGELRTTSAACARASGRSAATDAFLALLAAMARLDDDPAPGGEPGP
jgi:DNA-binding transcriptional LysR family regulator